MKSVTILGRKPKEPNKYGLIGSDISHLELVSRVEIKEPLFWRNNVINAWCISCESSKDMFNDEFWLGIYDKPYHQKLVRAYFTSWGGMCGYTFSRFYNPDEIENIEDLRIQEKSLKILNILLDKGIIQVHRPSGKIIPNK